MIKIEVYKAVKHASSKILAALYNSFLSFIYIKILKYVKKRKAEIVSIMCKKLDIVSIKCSLCIPLKCSKPNLMMTL